MYPTLFTIGPLTVHSFGLMVALGFLAALYAMSRIARSAASESRLTVESM